MFPKLTLGLREFLWIVFKFFYHRFSRSQLRFGRLRIFSQNRRQNRAVFSKIEFLNFFLSLFMITSRVSFLKKTFELSNLHRRGSGVFFLRAPIHCIFRRFPKRREKKLAKNNSFLPVLSHKFGWFFGPKAPLVSPWKRFQVSKIAMAPVRFNVSSLNSWKNAFFCDFHFFGLAFGSLRLLP